MKILSVATNPVKIKVLVYGQEKVIAGPSIGDVIKTIAKHHADGATKGEIRDDVYQVILEQNSMNRGLPFHED